MIAGRKRALAFLAIATAAPAQIFAASAAPNLATAPYPGGRPCNRDAAQAEIKGLTSQLSAVNVQIRAVEIQRGSDRDQIPLLNAGLPETQGRLDTTQRRIGTETGQIASLEKNASDLRDMIARRQAEIAACADKEKENKSGAAP